MICFYNKILNLQIILKLFKYAKSEITNEMKLNLNKYHKLKIFNYKILIKMNKNQNCHQLIDHKINFILISSLK